MLLHIIGLDMQRPEWVMVDFDGDGRRPGISVDDDVVNVVLIVD